MVEVLIELSSSLAFCFDEFQNPSNEMFITNVWSRYVGWKSTPLIVAGVFLSQ